MALAQAQDFARNTSRLMEIPIGDIVPSQLNPRKRFSPEALEELAASIRDHGLIEPIVVREAPRGIAGETPPLWSLIAGERRWRAAQLAGLDVLPAVVRHEPDDGTAIRLMLIENLHRQDLDPIEEAEGYRALRDLGVKQSEIAAAINRSQPVVANALRLLDLPEDVRELVQSGQLSAAHGRALVKYAKWPKLCAKIAEIAVAEALPSKRLEKSIDEIGGIDGHHLFQSGVLAEIDYRIRDHLTPEDGVEVWKQGYYGSYTPDIEAYAAAEKRISAEAEAELQRSLQKARDAAAAKGEKLIRLKDLPHDSYAQLTSYDGKRIDAPDGCPDDCYCRAVAQDSQGKTVIISTDPKHIEKLKRAKEREMSKARKTEAKERAALLDAILAKAPAYDRFGLAAVAADCLWQFSKPVAKRMIEEFCAGILKTDVVDDYNLRRDTYADLAKVPVENLLKLLVHGTLLNEMRDHLAYGGMSGRLGWYMEVSGTDPFLDADERTLKARLDEARAQARNSMHLPGEQSLWQDTVRALETRLAELKPIQGTEAIAAEILDVGACDNDVHAWSDEEQHARGKARGAIYGHLRKAGYQIALECKLETLDDDLLMELAHDASKHEAHRGVDWDALVIALEHVCQVAEIEPEYPQEVRAKLAEIEQSKAAIAAEAVS